MQVQDLINILSECDPEKEVLLATQPQYPLAFNLRGVYDPSTAEAWDEDDDDELDKSKVWLVQGDHPDDPYGVPRDSFDAYVG